MTSILGQSIGHYQILERIGEGGMAIVYKAFDTQLEREVAIKFIRGEIFGVENAEVTFKRFKREARLLAKLSHPNILTLLDHDQYEGQLYIVTSYIHGGSLRARLGKPLPWQEAVRLLVPIARALEYAHNLNILHRDIKPANILLTSGGIPVLADFGIAKVLENEVTRDFSEITQTDPSHLTLSGVGIGTPDYMAPEQGYGKSDYRSDIYSLGVVFYELVTGRRPFIANTPLAVLLMHITDPLPSPHEFVPDLPIEVESIILKALAKQPEDRYQKMTEFAEAICQTAKIYEEELRSRAINLEKDEKWDDALKTWHEVLAFEPEDQQAIQSGIERIQLMRELAGVYGEARDAIAQKDDGRAIRLLKDIVAKEATYKDALDLLSQTIKMRKSQAAFLEKNEKWDEALNIWREQLDLEPEDRLGIEAEIERIQRMQELASMYDGARGAMSQQDYDLAIKLLKDIIARDETYKDALSLLLRASKLRRTSQQSVSRNKWMWMAFGVCCAIALVFLSMTLLSSPDVFGSIGAGGSSLNTPTAPAGTEIATSTAVLTDTVAASPSSEQVRAFADPILASIAKRSPILYEDFSYAFNGWPVGSTDNGDKWGYTDEAYSIVVTNNYRNDKGDPCLDLTPKYQPPFSAFVLEVDEQFISGTTGNWHLLLNSLQPALQDAENTPYSINFFPDGSFLFAKGQMEIVKGLSPNFVPGMETNRVRVIVQENKIAAYINEEPLFLVKNAALQDDIQVIAFGACNNASEDSLLEVRFDNLKVWDITNLSSYITTPTPGAYNMVGADGASLVYVPEGNFIMGTNNGDLDEKPAHTVYLDAFWIDQTEVTNKMYAKCVNAGTCAEPTFASSNTHSNYYGNPAFDEFPVIRVNWEMAKTYCEWAGRRLPTEAEWEKAARGTDQRMYPWGNEKPNSGLLNYSNLVGDMTMVKSYPNGVSPYGAYDMAGNVWEWVSSLYQPYPYSAAHGRENMNDSGSRVLRGGSWYDYDSNVRSVYRRKGIAPGKPMGVNYGDIGFRCVLSFP
jgi:serine/threonine protein kinase/formylglycine-generating enzyme required for sulfatase activity